MNVGNQIKKFLTSPKTVITLIIITLVACLIGFFVPQITDKSPSFFEQWKEKNIYTYRFVDRLQLNRVYTSYWFLTLVVLIMISLGYSLYLQVKKNLRQMTEYRIQEKVKVGIDSFRGGEGGFERRAQTIERSVFTDKDRQKIREILRKRRYHEDTKANSGHKLIFAKNSIGRWGSVIFHLGLLLVVISAITVLCFQKRGFVQLIEGDLFDGRETGFLVKSHGVFAGEFNTGFKTHLSKLEHSYWEGGKLKLLESSLTVIKDTEAMDKKLSINNPLLIDGTNIYQSDDYGYTLSFVLKRPTGEEVLSHFNIDRADSFKKYAVGMSDFPLTDYIFKMKFLPDVSNRSFHLSKPILYLTVFQGGEEFFNGLIIPGNAVRIKGDILYFTGIRYWSGLVFVNNPGMLIAYIGFAIGILGTGIMFSLPYKEIHVTLAKIPGSNEYAPDFTIHGITRKYHALFEEEMEMIKNELKEQLKKGSIEDG